MALELLDPNATLEFIPESEKKGENPTIIHLNLSDVRDSLRRNRLFNLNRGNGEKVTLEYADDEVWFDYLVSRIVKIENVIIKGELKTLETKPHIAKALSCMSSAIGSELFAFIMDNSGLSERQRKN